MKNFLKFSVFRLLQGIFFLRKIFFKGGDFHPENIKNILLVETAYLGDVIAATPLIRTISVNFPKAEVSMVADKKYAPLIQDNPHIHKLIILDEINLRGYYNVISELRHHFFDLVISVSPGFRNSLISILSRSCYLTGYLINYSANTCFFHDHIIESVGIKGEWFYKKDEHLTVRALKAVSPIIDLNNMTKRETELFILPATEKKYLDFFILHEYIRGESLNIIIHPAAAWKFKQWSVENFISLLNALYDRYSSELNITVIGVPSEDEVLYKIKEEISFKINFLIGKELEQIMVLIKNCTLFIGNDSGPKHIADAFQRPLIELLGPGLPETVGAVNKNAVSVYHKTGCNPCTQQKCKHDGQCMKSISVGEVLAEAIRFIEQYQS